MILPVRDRRTFQALRADGIRVRRGPLAASFLARPGDEATQVAWAITKRVGGAVQRNRLRRRLRAVVRDLARDPEGPVLPGVLVISAGPEVGELGPEELRNDVERLLVAVAARTRSGASA